MDAGEAGDASLKSASPPCAGGPFQARFHWSLEDAVDDVLSFFFGASSFGVAWEVEMKGDDFLCLDLWEGWVLGRGPS